jgi:hypothetical protein
MLSENPLPDLFGALLDAAQNVRAQRAASHQMVKDGLIVGCHIWGEQVA